MGTITIWKVVLLALAVQAAAMGFAEADISCSTVASDLAPCLSFVTGSDSNPTPECCHGVKVLNAAARTTTDRRAACRCIKSGAAGYNYNSARAHTIPGFCDYVAVAMIHSTSCDLID